MEKQIVKVSEIAAKYCEINGYFPDEIVGASNEEMRAELILDGYEVEEIPAAVVRPESIPATQEEIDAFGWMFAKA